MSLTRRKETATELTQERTVAAEVVTKMVSREEAEKAVDAEVAEEATARDAEEAMAAPREEAVPMDATEEPTLSMKTETQLLSTVLRPVDSEEDTRASQEKATTHMTESPELAAEEETTADREAAMDGVTIRRRSQKPLMAKRSRESQPVKTTETEEETTATETPKDVPRETPQRRKSPRRKLDSPLMTTKPRRRLVTSRLPPEDSTRRSTRRVSRPTITRKSALRCLPLRSLQLTLTPSPEVPVLSFSVSEPPRRTSSSTAREDPQEVETVEAAEDVAATVVPAEATVVEEEVESPSSMPTTRMISQLCEVESTP